MNICVERRRNEMSEDEKVLYDKEELERSEIL